MMTVTLIMVVRFEIKDSGSGFLCIKHRTESIFPSSLPLELLFYSWLYPLHDYISLVICYFGVLNPVQTAARGHTLSAGAIKWYKTFTAAILKIKLCANNLGERILIHFMIKKNVSSLFYSELLGSSHDSMLPIMPRHSAVSAVYALSGY